MRRQGRSSHPVLTARRQGVPGQSLAEILQDKHAVRHEPAHLDLVRRKMDRMEKAPFISRCKTKTGCLSPTRFFAIWLNGRRADQPCTVSLAERNNPTGYAGDVVPNLLDPDFSTSAVGKTRAAKLRCLRNWNKVSTGSVPGCREAGTETTRCQASPGYSNGAIWRRRERPAHGGPATQRH